MGTFLNLVKKHVSAVTALAVLLTVFMPAMAHGSEVDTVNELEELLIYELADENIEIENIEITGDEIVIEALIEDADGEEVLTALEFAPGSSYMSFFAEVYNDEGVLEYAEFIIDLSNVEDNDGTSDEPLELMFEHVETSEYGVLSSADAEEDCVDRDECEICIACITLVGTIIGGVLRIAMTFVNSFIDTLLAVGTIIIRAGMVFISAIAAGAELVLMSFRPAAMNAEVFFHFEAVRHNGDVFIGDGLTDAEAAARLRSREDVWSVSSEHAQVVAAQASGAVFGRRANPFGPSNGANTGRQRNLYYDHFQPNPRPISGGHSFFGYEPRPGRFR